jgi:hypothetical protein
VDFDRSDLVVDHLSLHKTACFPLPEVIRACKDNMPTSQDVLRISIETHNDTFESLLSLIPPKYYLVKEDDADSAVRFPRRVHVSRS